MCEGLKIEPLMCEWQFIWERRPKRQRLSKDLFFIYCQLSSYRPILPGAHIGHQPLCDQQKEWEKIQVYVTKVYQKSA